MIESTHVSVAPLPARTPIVPRTDRAPVPTTAPVVITDVEGLKEIRAGVEQLRARLNCTVPGSDPLRFAAVLDADRGSSRPFIALWPNASAPRAVLMARIEPRSIRTRLGYFNVPLPSLTCLEVVHGGLLVENDPVLQREVSGFVQLLLDDGTCEHIIVHRIGLSDEMCSRLETLATLADPAQPSWSIDLVANDFDATMAHHSAKHRSNLRRIDRRLADRFGGQLELRVISRCDEVDEYFDIVRKIVDRTYHAQLTGQGYTEHRARMILEAEAVAGRLLCFILEGAGEPIAFQTGAVYDSIYYCDGTAYDAEFGLLRPGTVLLRRVIEHLCRQGLREVNFGYGDADYKSLYGTRSRMETNLRLFRKTGKAVAVALADRAIRKLHIQGLRIAGATGLAGRIRTMWRRRFQRLAARRSHRVDEGAA